MWDKWNKWDKRNMWDKWDKWDKCDKLDKCEKCDKRDKSKNRGSEVTYSRTENLASSAMKTKCCSWFSSISNASKTFSTLGWSSVFKSSYSTLAWLAPYTSRILDSLGSCTSRLRWIHANFLEGSAFKEHLYTSLKNPSPTSSARTYFPSGLYSTKKKRSINKTFDTWIKYFKWLQKTKKNKKQKEIA